MAGWAAFVVAGLAVASLAVAGRGGWLVGWGFEVELAVGSAGELGAAFVDLFVVAVAAQQAEIVDVGGAVVFPVDDVVGLAEAVGAAAADAAPVAYGEGDALGVAGVAVLASQPEGLALGVEDGRQDPGLKCQPDEFAGREGGAVDKLGVGELSGDGVVDAPMLVKWWLG